MTVQVTPTNIESIEIPIEVFNWFTQNPTNNQKEIIASAIKEYFAKTTQNQQLLDWLVDMDYKIVFDEYGIEMVCLHPASILFTEDPDTLPLHIINLLDKQVSYTNFDIFVDDNEKFWTAQKPDVHLESCLDSTGRTYITGAELEVYTVGDCLKMGRIQMTDISLWFAIPKLFFPCLC